MFSWLNVDNLKPYWIKKKCDQSFLDIIMFICLRWFLWCLFYICIKKIIKQSLQELPNIIDNLRIITTVHQDTEFTKALAAQNFQESVQNWTVERNRKIWHKFHLLGKNLQCIFSFTCLWYFFCMFLRKIFNQNNLVAQNNSLLESLGHWIKASD